MSSQKTIVFSIGSLSRGGAERVVVNLAEHFSKNGYKTYLFTHEVLQDEYTLSNHITRVVTDITKEEASKYRIINVFLRIKKLRRLWKTYKPDLIVSFIGKNNFKNVISSFALKIPVVVTVCGDPRSEYVSGLSWNMVKLIFPMAQGVVLKAKEGMYDFPKNIQRKIVTMPNPLNEHFVVDEFPKMRKKEIVAVGRVDENKNHKLLVDAFAQIAAQYPDWTCHLYGEGECKESLEVLVEKYGMTHQIFLHGRELDIVSVEKDASIHVLTSRTEGLPNALIEAMALGLACISTDCPCGGPKELITQGENGFLIPVDDEQQLVNRLEELMKDDTLRMDMGKQAAIDVRPYHPKEALKTWQTYLELIMK